MPAPTRNASAKPAVSAAAEVGFPALRVELPAMDARIARPTAPPISEPPVDLDPRGDRRRAAELCQAQVARHRRREAGHDLDAALGLGLILETHQRDQIAAQAAGVGQVVDVDRGAVESLDRVHHQIRLGRPAAVHGRLAGLRAGGDHVHRHALIADLAQQLERRVQDRRVATGVALATEPRGLVSASRSSSM